ncbi:VanZ family protein [Isoptericola sp. 4D.3]|uniref:VanZ family protein n=1 Tax=Isoptericola peretonis TaxID=2918523 RepID=A0ABT0J928_9MICO|nr:VanZ family protein [Isoptericola sp. 4D.3]
MLGGNLRFSPLPVAAGAALVLATLVAVTLADPARSRAWVRGLLAVSVAGVLALTMLGSWDGGGVANLVPGSSIRAGLAGEHALGLFNVLGNVLLFVPVGWLLALAVPRRRVLIAAVAGFGLSAAIEVTQSFLGRVVDVDDLILNGLGAVVGACLALLVRSARRPSRLGGAGQE